MNLPDADTVLAFVRKNPRFSCTEIAKALDAPPLMVSASLRALRAAGKLTSEGNTKGTRWTYAARKRSAQ